MNKEQRGSDASAAALRIPQVSAILDKADREGQCVDRALLEHGVDVNNPEEIYAFAEMMLKTSGTKLLEGMTVSAAAARVKIGQAIQDRIEARLAAKVGTLLAQKSVSPSLHPKGGEGPVGGFRGSAVVGPPPQLADDRIEGHASVASREDPPTPTTDPRIGSPTQGSAKDGVSGPTVKAGHSPGPAPDFDLHRPTPAADLARHTALVIKLKRHIQRVKTGDIGGFKTYQEFCASLPTRDGWGIDYADFKKWRSRRKVSSGYPAIIEAAIERLPD